MAFDPSIADLVRRQAKAFAKIENLIDLAVVRAQKSAGLAASRIMATISFDQMTKNLINKMFSGLGPTGARARSSFWQDFQRQTMRTMDGVRKTTGLLEDLEMRAVALANRQVRGFDEAAAAAQKVARSQQDISRQMRLYNTLISQARAQLARPGITAQERKALKERIGAYQQANRELRAHRKELDELPTKIRAMAMEEKLQDFREKVFGKIYKAQDKTIFAKNFATELIKSPAKLAGALVVGIVFAIVSIFKLVFDKVSAATKAMREFGYTGQQIATQGTEVTRLQAQLVSEGINASLENVAKARATLGAELGTLKLPDNLVKDAVVMSEHFGMLADEAARLQAMVFRLSDYNEKAAHSAYEFAVALAHGSGISPAVLLRQMAQHSEELAKAGFHTVDAFTRANAMTLRMGVNLSTISNLSDRFASDLEGTLESQALLGVFAPGVDLSRAIYAANYGSTEQMVKELRSAVTPLGDFDRMPRGMKLAISRAMNMSVEELTNLIKGDKAQSLQEKTYDRVAKIATEAARFVAGETTIIQILQNILTALLPLRFIAEKMGLAPPTLQQYKGDVKKAMADGMSRDDAEAFAQAMQRRRERIESQKKFHSGGVVDYSYYPRFHDGLMPNEVPAVLLRGEAVLTPSMLSGLTKLINSVSALGKIGDLANSILGNINPSSLISNFTGMLKGKSGGLTGLIGGLFGEKDSKTSILSKIPGIGDILGGKTDLKSVGTSLLSKIPGLGGILDGKTDLKSLGSSFLSKVPGVSGLLDKIPGGLGGIVSGFMSGGVKGGVQGLANFGTNKAIGALLGGPVGIAAMSVAEKIPGIGNLLKKNSANFTNVVMSKKGRKGMALTAGLGSGMMLGGLIGKKGLGGLAKSAGGAVKSIGKKIGGLFKKKKKKKPTPTPISSVPLGIPPEVAALNSLVSGRGMGISGVSSMSQSVDMRNVESLLKEVAAVIKSGFVVNLDGKKVGEGLTAAYSRG